MSRPLRELDLAVIFIDGTEFGEHTVITAIEIDEKGRKHILGDEEGSAENARGS
jgi:hypothetical protein